MIATWVGASRGGTRSPASSPCAMISPPTIRVELPHEVCQAELALAARGEEVDVERAGEVLPELVRGAHLQGLAVAGHQLQRHRVGRAGEPLPRGLAADHHRQRQHVDHEVLVHVAQDAYRVVAGVLLGRVRGVALLPEELGGAQQQPRPHLPADHVRPTG
jgi:hypothetical protein